MKRFTTDMLRVLKAHGGSKKQIKLEDFPQSFSIVFPNRDFSPEDYGLCYFPDLVTEMTENSTLVALVKEQGNQMLAVPKREQTPQEIHRTRIFASEVY
jgi:meiosis arrest female protein 1